MTTTTAVSSIGVQALRLASSADAKRAENVRLKEAGEIVADGIRVAGARVGKRIPETVHVVARSGAVYVVAGGSEAPNAYPFETGARHPLFARGPRGQGGWLHWYQMEKKPFMEEGEAATADEAAIAFAAVVDDWCRQIGWR